MDQSTRMTADAAAPLARSAMLKGFRRHAESLGLDADALAAAAGVDLAALTDPDLRVPAQAMGAMYEMAAASSGAVDFALRVVARRRMSNIGLVALVAREEPTLRQALRTFQRYLWLQNEALSLAFEEIEGGVLLRIISQVPLRRQTTELFVGMTVVVIRDLVGGHWAPREIYLPHAPAEGVDRYRQVLGVVPQFDHDVIGVLIDRADMDLSIPRADPSFVTQLRRQLEEATLARRSGFVASVRNLIETRLSEGDCDIDRIADLLGFSRRSLQRQLSGHGTSFSEILDQTRRSRAVSLLLESERGMERVADLLGFSSAGSFNQWFRQRFGCAPTSFRARAR